MVEAAHLGGRPLGRGASGRRGPGAIGPGLRRGPRLRAVTRTGPTLTFEGLSKSFGPVRAVDDLTFTVAPGAVTGFLGPNGVGQDHDAAHAARAGRPDRGPRARRRHARTPSSPAPARTVGAVAGGRELPPRPHRAWTTSRLRAPGRASAAALPRAARPGRADRRRGKPPVGGYSMGMRQRLGLATPLLGDPPAIVLDEPANGLDPEGIVWLRELLRAFAAEGRTVLVSSHVLGEVQHTVDDVVIIAERPAGAGLAVGRPARAGPPRRRLVVARHRAARGAAPRARLAPGRSAAAWSSPTWPPRRSAPPPSPPGWSCTSSPPAAPTSRRSSCA